MRNSICIFLFNILMVSYCLGQSDLSMVVYDDQTKQPIENVHLTFSVNQKYTDTRGKVTIKNFTGFEVHFSHIGYRDTSMVFHEIEKLVVVQIFLTPGTQELKTAEVHARPYEVFASETTNVFDFEWIHDSLLVLTYKTEKMLRKADEQSRSLYLHCQLFLVGPLGFIFDSIPLPDYTQRFYRDPLNQVFILTDSEVYVVKIFRGQILVEGINSEKFKNEIEPLNGESSTNYFFDNYARDYPEFSYFSLSKDSKTQKSIRTISAPFTMELFRAEYKYMSNYDKLRAIRLELQNGIDKEIIAAYMCGFPQSPYYQPLFAPLFSVGDTEYIFDPYSNYIFVHNRGGNPIDSVEINFNKTRRGKFARHIILDRSSHAFYAEFKTFGISYLKQISLTTGKGGIPIHLYYRYPEKIKVFQNRVYYLYRKTNSDHTKHLFAESLN